MVQCLEVRASTVGAQVQSLVGELRSCKLHAEERKKERKREKEKKKERKKQRKKERKREREGGREEGREGGKKSYGIISFCEY